MLERTDDGQVTRIRPNASELSRPWLVATFLVREALHDLDSLYDLGIDFLGVDGRQSTSPDDAYIDRLLAAGARPGDDVSLTGVRCKCGHEVWVETIARMHYDLEDLEYSERKAGVYLRYGPHPSEIDDDSIEPPDRRVLEDDPDDEPEVREPGLLAS